MASCRIYYRNICELLLLDVNPRTWRPENPSPGPQLDTWLRMAYEKEHLASLGQQQPFYRIWNLGGWPIMCRPRCCGWWWWWWGALFSAMRLQETEEAGEENRSGTGSGAGMRDPNHTVCFQISLFVLVLSSGTHPRPECLRKNWVRFLLLAAESILMSLLG